MNVLLLHKRGGLYGFCIRLWTRSRYIHSELEFLNGERFSSYPGHGTSFRPPLMFTDQNNWTRIRIDLTVAEEGIVREFCKNECGCPYDWLGITMTQFLPFGRQSKSKWFCSEVCTAALAAGLPRLSTVKPSTVSPKKLHKLLLG